MNPRACFSQRNSQHPLCTSLPVPQLLRGRRIAGKQQGAGRQLSAQPVIYC